MSDYNDGSKGLSKIALGFIGTFFSLLLAFIAKDYVCKAGYIWFIDKESQRSYGTILKNVVDDDVYKRIRIAADSVPKEKDEISQPIIKNDSYHRMQNTLNNLGNIEKITE